MSELKIVPSSYIISLTGYVAGMKMALPEGFTRTVESIAEEVEIPVSDPAPPDVGSKLFPVKELDRVCL